MTLNLSAQTYLQAPHAILADALERSVFEDSKIPFFGRITLVLGHPEIQDLLKDTDRFAVDARNAGHTAPYGMWFLPGSLKIMASNLLTMDDPDHRRLRRLVDEPFRRTAIDTLKPGIRETCERLVDEMAQGDSADLVAGLCRELPLLVIFDLLGFSPKLRAKLHDVMKDITTNVNAFSMLRGLMRLKPAQDAMR